MAAHVGKSNAGRRDEGGEDFGIFHVSKGHKVKYHKRPPGDGKKGPPAWKVSPGGGSRSPASGSTGLYEVERAADGSARLNRYVDAETREAVGAAVPPEVPRSRGNSSDFGAAAPAWDPAVQQSLDDAARREAALLENLDRKSVV